MAKIKINKPGAPARVQVNQTGQAPSVTVNRPPRLFSNKFSNKFR